MKKRYLVTIEGEIDENKFPCDFTLKDVLENEQYFYQEAVNNCTFTVKEWEDLIQYQKWKDEIRILITDEQNHGSIQISIPRYECDISGKADALIHTLYVDSSYRRKGVATKLSWLAERQVKLNGLQIAGIEFNKEESKNFVLAWYLRKGYKSFSKNDNLLIKEL